MTLALDRMRELWEFSPMSAAQIGAKMGVTKNTVIGLRCRKDWKPRGKTKERSTIFTRCAALHARMDAVLAETRPFVEDRAKVLVDAGRVAG